MTERKTEALFNEALIVSERLEQNLQEFDQNSGRIERIHADLAHIAGTIEKIALFSEEKKNKEARKFAQMIKQQIDRYYIVLQEVDLDTREIESLIERYNDTLIRQSTRLEESARSISATLEENGEAIIAAAHKLKRSKGSMLYSFILFMTGVIIGALFLAASPIATATKTFHDELVKRDTQIQRIKEQYETNSKMITFLKANDITVKTGTTNDSWNRESLRFAPMLLFKEQKVSRVDEISGYKRIIFKKLKERN
jgi:hypothetical protein